MKNFESVNKYLADIVVLNTKVHNLHWNVVGSGFKVVHEYLDEIYEYLTDIVDDVAEMVKMQGGVPTVKLADYLKITGIKEEESRAFAIREAFEITLEDLKYIRDEALKIREGADEVGNFRFANLMEDHIEAYDKYIWFISSGLEK